MSSRGHSQDRNLSPDRETPFSGYGDRVGSGVAYAPTQWKGGELVTDPALVTKSLKTRKFYYSPIGDGVVAADGVELKRLPPDLSPKVEVIQQRIVEKGPGGKAGVKVTEKTWTTGGGDTDANQAYGQTQMGSAPPTADSGRSGGRPDGDPFANLGGGDQTGGPARPVSTQSAPATKNGFGGPPKDQFGGPAAPASAKEPPAAAAAPPPAQWGGPSGPGAGLGPGGPAAGGPAIGSTRSTPGLGQIPVSNGTNLFDNQYPASGRTSVQSSASLYEPGYRYEIKKDYLVTNPRELIHEYATTTPVTTIDPSLGETTRTITRQHYTQTVEESFGPFPPYGASNAVTPLKFVRQLRDETMTDSQRQANQQQTPLSANAKDAQFEKRIDEIRRSTSRAQNDPIIDQLASQMRQSGAFGKP